MLSKQDYRDVAIDVLDLIEDKIGIIIVKNFEDLLKSLASLIEKRIQELKA
jgi:hypothetical protein